MSSGCISQVFLTSSGEKIAEPPAKPLILLALKAKGGTGADHLDLMFFFASWFCKMFWTLDVAAVSETPNTENSISVKMSSLKATVVGLHDLKIRVSGPGLHGGLTNPANLKGRNDTKESDKLSEPADLPITKRSVRRKPTAIRSTSRLRRVSLRPL